MRPYNLCIDDCSDVISEGLNVSKDNNDYQIKNGETDAIGSMIYDAYTEKPNIKYDKIKKRNKNV